MSTQPRRTYTEEERAAAKADLIEKVSGLMADMTRMALERVEKLDADYVNIVRDHLDNGSNFATPKDFILALCKEGAHQYRRPYPNRRTNRVIESYYIHM